MAEESPPGDAPPERIRVIHSGDSVEIIADLDRRRAEALVLEVRALARRYGLEATSVQIEVRGNPSAGTSEGAQKG